MKHAYFLLFFLLFGLLIYFPGFHVDFMIDDRGFMGDNIRNIKHVLSSFVSGSTDMVYRPLVYVFVRVGYFLFGSDPFGYHVLNLVVLVLACLCMYGFFSRVFGNKPLGFLTALFFLVHPINHYLVDYVTTGYFCLQVIFMLGCIYWGAHKDFGLKNFILSLGCFVFAVLCHETAMALPFFILCFLLFAKRQPLPKALARSMPFFVALVAYFIFRMNIASLGGSIFIRFGKTHMDVWQFMATFIRLVDWQMSKLFYPDGIVIVWASQIVRQNLWQWFLLGGAWLGVLCYLMVRGRVIPGLCLGLSWVVVGFVPLLLACFIEPVAGLTIEPYWLVFASMGFCLFVAALIVELARRIHWPKAAFAACLITGLWGGSVQAYHALWMNERVYNFYWLEHAGDSRNPYVYLTEDFMRHRENNLARYYLGQFYEKYHEENTSHYYYALGLLDLRQHRWGSSKGNFLKAARLNPYSYDCYTHLGILAYQANDMAQAKKYFLYVMGRDHFAILPRLNMAMIYNKEGDFTGGIRLLREILAIDPRYELARVLLLRVYWDQRNIPAVLEQADVLLKDSQDHVVLNNIGIMYQSAGKTKQAKQAFEKAKKY